MSGCGTAWANRPPLDMPFIVVRRSSGVALESGGTSTVLRCGRRPSGRGLANRGGRPCQAHEVPSYRKLRSPERHRANICACFIHTDISDKIDQARSARSSGDELGSLRGLGSCVSRQLPRQRLRSAAEHRERRSRHDGIQPGQDLARGHRCDPASHRSQMKKSISVGIAG